MKEFFLKISTPILFLVLAYLLPEPALATSCRETDDCGASGMICLHEQCIPSGGCVLDEDCPQQEASGVHSVCRQNSCVRVECSDDSHCPYGRICGDANMCVLLSCSGDSSCGTNRKCVEEVCTWRCTQDAQCSSGKRCNDGICNDKCRDDSHCPDEGAICLAGSCLSKQCTSDADCGGGRVCYENACLKTGYRAPQVSDSTDACKCPDTCYKFGEKMGTGMTDLIAASDSCSMKGCVVHENYGACLQEILEAKQAARAAETQESGATEADPTSIVVPDVSVLNALGTTDINTVLGRIIKGAMGIMGSIALVMIVYGGVLWMTAAGSSEKSGKAMQILIWSSLGIVLIFASYAVVDIVFEAFR